jgi:hypothetical protein
VIAGIIAAVVVLVVIGAAAVWMTLETDVGEATVTRTPSDASAESSVDVSEDAQPGVEAPMLEDQAYSIGMSVRDGNFEFVVNGIERASVVSDPEFPDLQKEHQGEYVMVKMQVTNVGAEPQTFFASFNTLSDGATEFSSDDEAWICLGTDPESIELHGGQFSEGVTVGL